MSETEFREFVEALDRVIPALVDDKVRGIVAFQLDVARAQEKPK